jgi:hypothetical protein
MEEMKNTKRLQVLVSEEMHQQITFYAENDGISISEWVRRAIRLEISRRTREAAVDSILEQPGDEISLTEDMLEERARDLEKEESKGSGPVSDLVIQEREEGY